MFFDVGRANWYRAISDPTRVIDRYTAVALLVFYCILELLWWLWLDKKDRNGRPRYLTGIILVTLTAAALGAVIFDVGGQVVSNAHDCSIHDCCADHQRPRPRYRRRHRRRRGHDSTPQGRRRRRTRDGARRECPARDGHARHPELTCRLTGEKTYRREVGYCATANGIDINRAIIAQGAALACPRYDDRYVPFEQAAALAAQPRSSYCVKRS